MQHYNLMIVDDHEMVRQGIETAIKMHPEFTTTMTANSGNEALKELEKATSLPDIALIDVLMPDMNGVTTAIKIKDKYPSIKIILLSMEISSEYVKEAYKNQIESYIPKYCDIDKLSEAIKTVGNGGTFYDSKVKDFIFSCFVNNQKISLPKIPNLSEREVEILKLIANGLSYKIIGQKLFISPKTVEAHRNNIVKKLKLKSTADLIKFALAKKLTHIPAEMLEDEY